MSVEKSLLTRLAETVDEYRAERQVARDQSLAPRPGWLRWLGRQMIPNVGTLLLVAVMLLTVPSLAAPHLAPEAASTSTISYQGRLADSAGNPLTGYYNLEFRVYDVPVGGVPLWEEFWTGGNSVQVSDGLFNVMLGSTNNTLAAAIDGHDELYLGITVGTDSEMVPRVQLGSVPFSMQAMTVPHSSITTENLAPGSVSRTLNAKGVQWSPTTVSTTYVDLPDMSITFTPSESNVPLLVLFDGNFEHDQNDAGVQVALFIDGQEQVVTKRYQVASTGNRRFSLGFHYFTSSLDSSAHTLTVKWLSSTSNLPARAVEINRELTILELKR